MTEITDFLRNFSSTVPHPYEGNPLELDSFKNSINLLKELATSSQKSLLFKFLKTRTTDKVLGKSFDKKKSSANRLSHR